ncbi:hypothetical protein HaLaN_21137, partial [Haematococcus lacustris]
MTHRMCSPDAQDSMAAKSGWMASSCCWEVPGGRQIISVPDQLAAVWHAAPPPSSNVCSHPGQLASSLQGV